MPFIPDEDLKEPKGLTMAPMVDFLFLMLAVFASLAVSRMVIKETDIDLVKADHGLTSSSLAQNFKRIHITIDASGDYKWVTEIRDYPMESADAIAKELIHQYAQGLLPEEKLNTQILLKIDRLTPWEPILKVVLAVKELGFDIRPLYEPEKKAANPQVSRSITYRFSN